MSQEEILKPKHKYGKYFPLIFLFIPILLIIFTELGLRFYKYGEWYDQWVSVSNNRLMLNPKLAYKFFQSPGNIPSSIEDTFLKIKPDSTYRVFILGGSTAAGYPYMPNGAFSRYLQKYLDNTLVNTEVVNLGVPAMNSYFMRDIVPGIIDQKPDLIIIHSGHNEYYGALGVGSSQSIGLSPWYVNSILKLYNYKIIQVIRDGVKYIRTVIFKNLNRQREKGSTGLMMRMAEKKKIPFDGEIYNSGLNQFEINLEEIIKTFQKINIPIVMGTISSNVREFPPFQTLESDTSVSRIVFSEGLNELSLGKYAKGDSLLRHSKDLDVLRFRGPEAINKIIKESGKKFSVPVADIDSVLSTFTKYGSLGYDIMTDHVHPNLFGYKQMAQHYMQVITRNNYLKFINDDIIENNTNYSQIVDTEFNFSILDSSIAERRLYYLMNRWPFVVDGEKNDLFDKISDNNFIDTLARAVATSEMEWHKAHGLAAEWYLKNNKLDLYQSEIDVLIDQYPYIPTYMENAAKVFLSQRNEEMAHYYFSKHYYLEPSALNSKWLGILSLWKKENNKAIEFLKESAVYNNKDAQTYYNLAQAYYNKGNYSESLNSINRCLVINSKFPQADRFREVIKYELRKRS